MVLADSSMYSRGWLYRDCRLDRLRSLSLDQFHRGGGEIQFVPISDLKLDWIQTVTEFWS